METPIDWRPADGAVPEQLILLLHAWASEPADLLPLAEALRAEFPRAAIVAPRSPTPADGGRRGRQWYSIEGIEERGVWPARVQGQMPLLLDWVCAQQQRCGVGTAATAIGGFSQGAILSLALASRHDGLAGRVLAFGGCFVTPPPEPPRLTTYHLFHGSADKIIPADGSRQALQWLADLQGDATIDIADGVGHVLHPALIDRCLHRLRSHIPARTWAAALGDPGAMVGAAGV